ncbi:hypothetical protein [Nitrogeniibacter aestuarii]|uniref:hypothetical protein n=1 Tax=Nitrogeniibacter aestuarii TaxID=2815343 RepID=UPI001E6574B0|nr:hypothetical protein [Nitrogeniibacter aestuarii]
MSQAFDRFVSGQGTLAALIASQPRFDPPAGMFERVLSVVDTAQSGLSFAPPSSIEAAVLAEAARLDAAQAPRRDALLDQIAAGTEASTALGAAVSPQTARWLAEQADRRAAPRRTQQRASRKRWFNGFGLAAAAAIAASVALKIWTDPTAPTMEHAAVRLESAEQVAERIAAKPAAPMPEADARPPEPAAAAAPIDQAQVATAPRRERETHETPPSAQLKQKSIAERKAAVPTKRETAPTESLSNSASEEHWLAAPQASEDRAVADLDDTPMADMASPTPAAEPMAAARAPAPLPIWDLPLATPGTAIAQRMQTQPPQAWLWIVHPDDATAAEHKRLEVMSLLEGDGRSDTVRIDTADRPTGSLRIRRVGD